MSDSAAPAKGGSFVQQVHGVRYLVRDLARSVDFFTGELGFALEHQQPPAFAAVSPADGTASRDFR